MKIKTLFITDRLGNFQAFITDRLENFGSFLDPREKVQKKKKENEFLIFAERFF